MKTIYIFFFVSILNIGCDGSYSTHRLKQLDEEINRRTSVLQSNYKYQTLSYYEHFPNIDSLISYMVNFQKSGDSEQLVEEIMTLSTFLNLNTVEIDQASLQSDIRIAMILILDELLIRTLNHTSNFSLLQPKVFLERDTDSTAYFQVVILASDTLSLPEVVLELSTGSFLIMVDPESGIAHFSMDKENPSDKKEFKGQVYYGSDDNRIKIGDFKYPQELKPEKY